MTAPDEITPGERRELRSVVRGQFKVLRAEVKRRQSELKAEVEAELLDRYREEDQAIAEARRDAQRRIAECVRDLERIGDELRQRHPDLTVEAGASSNGRVFMGVANHHRSQLHRALIAAIPDQIGNANLELDRGENQLLRKLSEGALESEHARAFLGEIPTVGELVPRSRLREIERSMGDPS